MTIHGWYRGWYGLPRRRRIYAIPDDLLSGVFDVRGAAVFGPEAVLAIDARLRQDGVVRDAVLLAYGFPLDRALVLLLYEAASFEEIKELAEAPEWRVERRGDKGLGAVPRNMSESRGP